MHLGDCCAGEDGNTQLFGLAEQAGINRRTKVCDVNGCTGSRQVKSTKVGRIVVDAKQRVLSRSNRIAVHVSRDGAGQHHAGFVVARKNQRTLNRTTRHHDGGSPNSAHALAGNAKGGICHARRGALNDANGIAVVNPKSGCAGEPFDFAGGINVLQRLLQPFRLRTVNAVVEQVATHLKILLYKHDVGPCAGGVERGT